MKLELQICAKIKTHVSMRCDTYLLMIQLVEVVGNSECKTMPITTSAHNIILVQPMRSHLDRLKNSYLDPKYIFKRQRLSCFKSFDN